MTRFWWVRHGPTHQTAFTGWRDVPADLSDIAALDRLNGFLPAGALLVSSDLSRAHATANALASGRRRLPDRAGLREFHFGDWDGRHFTEVAETHPELSRDYWENPGTVAPPGGESWNDVAKRAGAEVAELRHSYVGQEIVVVAHAGVILTQVQVALGVSASQALSHRIDNLSVTCLAVDASGWQVEAINHVP